MHRERTSRSRHDRWRPTGQNDPSGRDRPRSDAARPGRRTRRPRSSGQSRRRDRCPHRPRRAATCGGRGVGADVRPRARSHRVARHPGGRGRDGGAAAAGPRPRPGQAGDAPEAGGPRGADPALRGDHRRRSDRRLRRAGRRADRGEDRTRRLRRQGRHAGPRRRPRPGDGTPVPGRRHCRAGRGARRHAPRTIRARRPITVRAGCGVAGGADRAARRHLRGGHRSRARAGPRTRFGRRGTRASARR